MSKLFPPLLARLLFLLCSVWGVEVAGDAAIEVEGAVVLAEGAGAGVLAGGEGVLAGRAGVLAEGAVDLFFLLARLLFRLEGGGLVEDTGSKVAAAVVKG